MKESLDKALKQFRLYKRLCRENERLSEFCAIALSSPTKMRELKEYTNLLLRRADLRWELSDNYYGKLLSDAFPGIVSPPKKLSANKIRHIKAQIENIDRILEPHSEFMKRFSEGAIEKVKKLERIFKNRKTKPESGNKKEKTKLKINHRTFNDLCRVWYMRQVDGYSLAKIQQKLNKDRETPLTYNQVKKLNIRAKILFTRKEIEKSSEKEKRLKRARKNLSPMLNTGYDYRKYAKSKKHTTSDLADNRKGLIDNDPASIYEAKEKIEEQIETLSPEQRELVNNIFKAYFGIPLDPPASN